LRLVVGTLRSTTNGGKRGVDVVHLEDHAGTRAGRTSEEALGHEAEPMVVPDVELDQFGRLFARVCSIDAQAKDVAVKGEELGDVLARIRGIGNRCNLHAAVYPRNGYTSRMNPTDDDLEREKRLERAMGVYGDTDMDPNKDDQKDLHHGEGETVDEEEAKPE
jgi:hypothetical protein